jgi:hypothetical protein
VVGRILKQRHRTAKLAWAHARRRWRLHTWQHILFSNESRFSLRFSDGRYRVNRRRGERFTDQCVYTRPTVLEAEVLWSGLEFVLMVCTQLKIVQRTLNAVKYRDDILDPIVPPFLQQRNFEHVFQYDNVRCHGLVFVKTFWTRITSVLFLGRYYHRICHQFNIYGMNSVDMFVIVKLHQKHYRSCMMHLCTSGTTSPQAFIQQLVLCVGDAKLSLLEEVVIHVTELHKSPYCMTISVCPGFVLIMMLRNFFWYFDIALYATPIWI